MVDSEQFITLVGEYPALWDKSHSDYHDKMKIENIWNEIEEDLRMASEYSIA